MDTVPQLASFIELHPGFTYGAVVVIAVLASPFLQALVVLFDLRLYQTHDEQ